MISNLAKTSHPVRVSAECTIAGESAVLDQSGALFLPESGMLVVADLHFEKASSFARRRVFLPPYDTSVALFALEDAARHFAPRTILFLGDSFHDVEGPDRLEDGIFIRLNELASGRDMVWITGNHDPLLPATLPGMNADELALGALHFTHVPERGASGQISGHLHPVASVRGRGRTVRRRCFATDGNRMILPSFGALTGGLSLQDRAFDGLFEAAELTAYAIGDSAIHALPASVCGR